MADSPETAVSGNSAGAHDVADVMERVIADLLDDAHLMPLDALADTLCERARPLGVRRLEVYFADLQQRYLRRMPSSRRTGGDEPPAELPIDTTLAGRAFQTVTACKTLDDEGLFRLWIPVIDGTERLGVLELILSDVGEVTLRRCRMLASLAAMMIASKSAYSDTYSQVRRRRPLAMQAEMEWAFMAPPAFATDRVLVAAALEPAYEAGGDAYDYSLLGDRLSVAVIDAAGHDLTAGLIASVAMAGCRNTRRAGGDLVALVDCVDHAIAEHFDETRFATALLCELDIATGHLTWVVCGHPPPLLIRENQVVKELVREPHLPLGVRFKDIPPQVHGEQLEPGDRILLYTDGVVEGRGADGRQFGLKRLSDFVIRHSARGMSAPETLRRLTQAVVDYQQGRLADDSTIVLLEWLPSDPGHQLTLRDDGTEDEHVRTPESG
jgi:serine phosphatase RsbU (regulator of sigma subunit)